MAVQLFLAFLSIASLLSVRWILAQPSRPEERIVFVPRVVATVPDATLDWKGLV